MADSLDDFFAKKDKKRKDKGKSSTISAVALVKELEEGAKQAEYQVRKEGKTSTALELLGLDTKDEDWKDFEEIEKRDYTGLKVKEMSIQDQEDEIRRQVERSEQASESVPWKSKEGTVAAITSANNDSTSALEQQLLGRLSDDQVTSDKADDAIKITSDTKSTEPNEDLKTIANEATEADDAKKQSKETNEESNPDSTEGAEKEGDSKKSEANSAKSASAPSKYVPPHERMGAVQLEPMKMKHLVRPGSSLHNTPINLKDENEYPSLG